MQIDPKSVLMPIVIYMPLTLVDNITEPGSMESNFVDGTRFLDQKQYVKAFKCLKIVETQFKKALKQKGMSVDRRSGQDNQHNATSMSFHWHNENYDLNVTTTHNFENSSDMN